MKYVALSAERKRKISLDDLLSPEKRIESARREGEKRVEDFSRHGVLVGPGVRRALVPEENAGGRTARLVRAAFRDGRGQFEFLLRAGCTARGAMVRDDAGRIRVRRKAASIAFPAFDESQLASTFLLGEPTLYRLALICHIKLPSRALMGRST